MFTEHTLSPDASVLLSKAQAETQPAPPIESRIEPAYTQFFEDALESFLNEIQSAGG